MNATSDRPAGREPLLLIHGIGATPACWDTLVPFLTSRYDVYTITLPGHFGGDPFPRGRPSVKMLADEVERMMDELGLATAHICGNSLGGWLALELGARGRARTVVALAPAGGWRRRFVWQEFRLVPMFLIMRVLARIGLLIAKPLLATAKGRKFALRDICERGDTLSPDQAKAQIVGFVHCKGFWRLIFGEVFGPMLKSTPVKVPTTIVWGNKDRLLPLRTYADRWYHQLHGAQWRLWPGVGHMPMIDEPGLTAQAIDETVAQQQHIVQAA